VLLLSGHGTTKSQWYGWPKRIAQQGFYVISMDSRDTGLSQRFEQPSLKQQLWRLRFGLAFTYPYTLADLARDSASLLQTLNIPSAHIIGMSMGGLVAQLMGVYFPQQCSSLTLIMTGTDLPRAVHSSLLARPRILKSIVSHPSPHRGMSEEEYIENRIGLVRLTCSDPSNPQWLSECRAAFRNDWLRGGVDWGDQGGDRHTLAIQAWTQSPAFQALRSQLTRCELPSLVLHGRHDPVIGVEHGKQLAEDLPNSTFLEYDGMHDLPPRLADPLVFAITAHLRGQLKLEDSGLKYLQKGSIGGIQWGVKI
jgi:pimeloyl-ACP methyl ester carboxylesterase